MVYLKSCPKCQGDLTMRQDGYGAFISCLQCGLMRDIDINTKPATAIRSPVAAMASGWSAEEEPLARAA